MSDLPVSVSDLGVLAVVLLSVGVALYRGLTREILKIAAWIAAIAIGYYTFGEFRTAVGQTIPRAWLADVVTVVIVFVVPLLILRWIFRAVVDGVYGVWFGRYDRWGGAAFGLVRGGVLVVLLWFLVDLAVAPEQRPPWLQDGVTVPYVQYGADMITELLPERMRV